MSNKRFPVIVSIIIMLFMTVAIHAASPEEQEAADVLYQLGLFRGTENGYELDKDLTRAEAVTMIVRFLGEEGNAIANADAFVTPFTDVPEWARPYVGYAYIHNITKGVSADAFDAEAPVTSQQFLTFMLRVLRYSDADGDFVWDAPENLAVKAGLLTEIYADEFLRGNMVTVCKNALTAVYKNSELPVWKTLCEKNVFTEEMYHDATGESKEDNAESTSAQPSGHTGGATHTHGKTKENENQPTDGDTKPESGDASENNDDPPVDDNKPEVGDNDSEPSPDKPRNDNDQSVDDNKPGTVYNMPKPSPDKPMLIVESAPCVPGETVEVAVKVVGNPGILGMILTLSFDENMLKLESAESGEVLKGVLEFTSAASLSSGSRFLWDGVEITQEQVKDGAVLVLRFRALPEAEGETVVRVSYEDGDIVNNDLEEISLKTVEGVISVK